MRRPLRRASLALAWTLVWGASWAQPAASWAASGAERSVPQARAAVARGPVQIDGRLSEPAWRHVRRYGGFVERKPRLRATPRDNTWFSVIYDGSFLYIGVFCADAKPALIRARTTARDSFAVFSDDAISIKIDADHDRRTTAGFVLNPAGARLDYRGINERQMRREFDTRWFGASARVPGGWSAEFRIPWASLGVDPADPPPVMGLNLSRDHAHRNATYDWALMPPPFRPISASLYGRLTGFESLPGLPRQATPTEGEQGPDDAAWNAVPWVLSGGRVEPNASGKQRLAWTVNAGADANFRLGSKLRAQLTVNTDFAQVNVDDQVVNLGRFSLFMPEKREFFLRDVEVFTFGRAEQAQLFHSRRIGLNSGRPIPILLGFKSVAQVGDHLRFGVLDVVTRPLDATADNVALPWTNHSVARAQWQFDDGSNVGVMWTHRQSLQLQGDHNTVLGLDGAFRGAGTPLLVEAFALVGRNGGRIGGATADVGAVAATDPDAGKTRAGAAVDVSWRGLLVRPTLAYSWFDDGFRSDLGFFRRVGVHTGAADLIVEPRIGRYDLEKLTLKGWANGVAAATDGALLDTGAGGRADLYWNSGYHVGLLADQTRVTVRDPFTVGRSTAIDTGVYHHTRIGGGVATPWVRAAGASAWLYLRDYFGGSMLQGSGSLVLRPGGYFRLEAGWSVSRVTFSDDRPSFTAVVINGRAAVGFSPDLNLDMFVGWNRLTEQVPVNMRLRWTWRPNSDVFIVWQGIFGSDQSEFQSVVAKWTWSLP